MKRVLFSSLAVGLLLVGAATPAFALPFALTPDGTIDVSSGSGIISGHVDTGHMVFAFQAFAGDVIDIDIDVTAIFPGTSYTDDDSMLYLFDKEGHLLTMNDDFGGSLQSFINDFTITATDTYYVGVTTYNNRPIFSNGVIVGWEDDGMSSIDFDLKVMGVSPAPVPEPATLFLFGSGLVLFSRSLTNRKRRA